MGNLGVPTAAARESKPINLKNGLDRLDGRICNLENLVGELRGAKSVGTEAVDKSPTPCFELIYNSAPKMLEEYCARIDNAIASLREILI